MGKGDLGFPVGHHLFHHQNTADHDGSGDDTAQRTDFEPAEKGHAGGRFFLQHAQCHDVGGTADHGDVAAEAGTEKQSPPEGEVFDGGGKLLDHRTESGHEDHVIHKRRTEGGNSEDKGNQFRRSITGDLGKSFGHFLIDMGVFQSSGHGKEEHEEDRLLSKDK